jgi:hypothetical protein
MFSYYDPHFPQDGLYGIAEHSLYHYDSWARIDITQGLFSPQNNSGGELTITLLHEAAHGLYGWPDDGRPEAVAQRCYKP